MKLSIRKFGDPVLRQMAKPIIEWTRELDLLVENMVETMLNAGGIGLAAPQVGIDLRLVVVWAVPNTAAPMHVLINPVLELSKQMAVATEGCLSFPEITTQISRPTTAVVHTFTRDVDPGNTKKIKLTPHRFSVQGLEARAIQHEVDHLNGVLFIDHMSPAARAALNEHLMPFSRPLLSIFGSV